MSTEDRVIKVVSEVLEVPFDEVHLTDHFIDDLGANSLDIVNLIWRLEDVFALGEIPEASLEAIATVGDLVALVEPLRSGEPSEVMETVDVVVASDHAGVALKTEIVKWLKRSGRSVLDLGPNEEQSVDYPEFAELVGLKVVNRDAHRGVLICGSGIGMSIAANKVFGLRAAMVSEPVSAALCRRHNNANVLCLGARLIGVDMALACLQAFLTTDFEPGDDGRHQRRIQRITDIEKSEFKRQS